jgi:hypothetical protein
MTPNLFWMKLGPLRASLCTWVGHSGDQRWFQCRNNRKRRVTYPMYQFLRRKKRVEWAFLGFFCSNIQIWTLLHPFWPLIVSRMKLKMTYVRDRLSMIRTRNHMILRFIGYVLPRQKGAEDGTILTRNFFWTKLGPPRASSDCFWRKKKFGTKKCRGRLIRTPVNWKDVRARVVRRKRALGILSRGK